MKKETIETLFRIEGKNLYMDKVLIKFERVPVYFICKDIDDYRYIAYMPDYRECKYFVFEASMEDIYNLLNSTSTMREVLLKQPHYWDILAHNDDVSKDIVDKMDISEIDKEILPCQHSYFNIVTEEDRRYFNDFKEEMQGKGKTFNKFFISAQKNYPLILEKHEELGEYADKFYFKNFNPVTVITNIDNINRSMILAVRLDDNDQNHYIMNKIISVKKGDDFIAIYENELRYIADKMGIGVDAYSIIFDHIKDKIRLLEKEYYESLLY